MTSHTTLPGGIKLTLGKGGIRFTKKPSAYNNCIGDELRGESYKSRKDVKEAFRDAVKACK